MDARESTQTVGSSCVLITGAAGGLGKAFAVECASRGWDLLLTDLRDEPLRVLAASLETTYGVRAGYYACDLTRPESRGALMDWMSAEGACLWALINVAGIDHEGRFHQQSLAHIRTILRLNIEASVELMHSTLAFRDPFQPFRILNVASLAAFYPMPEKATYAASKRFLLDFSLALREELRELGATVTALCPAGIPTTPENICAIEAQGLLGQISTRNIGVVAYEAVESMLKGKAVCIPGGVNRLARVIERLAPAALIAHVIGRRWSAAHQRSARAGSSPAQGSRETNGKVHHTGSGSTRPVSPSMVTR